MNKAKRIITMIEASEVDPNDDEEINLWISNDEGLYRWAEESGVDVEEIGDLESASFKRFIDDNREEIVAAINKVLGKKPQ